MLGTSAYLLYSGHEWSYRNIVMPLVRLMDPERSHRFAVKLASWKLVPRDSKEDSSLLVRVKPFYWKLYLYSLQTELCAYILCGCGI